MGPVQQRGVPGVDGIRQYLENSSGLTQSEREKLLKLVWLLGQVSNAVRDGALKEIRPYIHDEKLDRAEFMEKVAILSERLNHERTQTPDL